MWEVNNLGDLGKLAKPLETHCACLKWLSFLKAFTKALIHAYFMSLSVVNEILTNTHLDNAGFFLRS